MFIEPFFTKKIHQINLIIWIPFDFTEKYLCEFFCHLVSRVFIEVFPKCNLVFLWKINVLIFNINYKITTQCGNHQNLLSHFFTNISWKQSYYKNVDFTNFFPWEWTFRFSTLCTLYKTSLQAILSIWMTKYQGAQVWSSSIALWQISPLKKMASLTTKEEQHWYLLLRLRRGQQEEGKVDPNQELLCTLLLVLYYMS